MADRKENKTNPSTFVCNMDSEELKFKKGLPDTRLPGARQLYLLSEFLDKTSEKDLIKYARHLKPYLPLLLKIKETKPDPVENT